MTTPSRQELVTGALASLVFVALGGAMLLFATLPPFMRMVAWAAVALGLVGLAGAAFRLTGRTLGPSAATLDNWAAERAARRPKRRAKQQTMAQVHHKGPLPQLAPARKGVVNRIIAGLADHGVLGPDRPDPSLAYPGVADFDGTVTTDIVLGALAEAGYYFPETDPARFFGNLFFLDTKVEQHPDYLRQQVVDLARIGGLDVADIVIDAPWPPQGRTMPVTVSMQANGAPLTISYVGDVKYHSTHIAVALARAIDAAATGRRLAAIGSDQGYYVTAIAADAQGPLNAALKRTARHEDYWGWVSEWTPYAAGDQP